MITSFADAGTQEIFNGVDSKVARKTCPKDIWSVAKRKLDYVNAAVNVMDLRAPPGNRLEKLEGDLAGKWSIRINDQYRIIFTFDDTGAGGVQILDYH